MGTEYIIGVDGGATKTDYLLFTTEGEFVDALHLGTRSHEVLEGGFAEVEETLLADLEYLLEKNGIEKAHVAAAAFGLAGIDTPAQLSKIKEILNKASLRSYVVANDSILGIKVGCPSGVGICSINGTGTVASGIDENGEVLQVGGIGSATGDYAGGSIIASLAVRAVYDYYFRCGDATVMADQMLDIFQLTGPEELLNAISDKFYSSRKYDKEIITILFDSANSGDAVAQEIVRDIARQLAKSVSGCIRRLHFSGTPEVVLAGSIWTKAHCPLLLSHFRECIFQYTEQWIDPQVLKVIPAAGAIIWATEVACNHPATALQRAVIFDNMPDL
jgi:N-acetylglucosamine kinase-like BadF-type ATPase